MNWIVKKSTTSTKRLISLVLILRYRGATVLLMQKRPIALGCDNNPFSQFISYCRINAVMNKAEIRKDSTEWWILTVPCLKFQFLWCSTIFHFQSVPPLIPVRFQRNIQMSELCQRVQLVPKKLNGIYKLFACTYCNSFYSVTYMLPRFDCDFVYLAAVFVKYCFSDSEPCVLSLPSLLLIFLATLGWYYGPFGMEDISMY